VLSLGRSVGGAMSLCDTCNGACCRWFLLPGPWLAQLPADVETWYRLHGASEIRGVAVDRPCRALDLVSGRCTIYETRPQMCRLWPEGSAGCLESRAKYGPMAKVDDPADPT
jgi:Fe-S-cluster containining protein